MKQEKLYKRFSVEVCGRLVAVFDSFAEAYDFINYSRWVGLAQIYDNEAQKVAESYIII